MITTNGWSIYDDDRPTRVMGDKMSHIDIIFGDVDDHNIKVSTAKTNDKINHNNNNEIIIDHRRRIITLDIDVSCVEHGDEYLWNKKKYYHQCKKFAI